MSGVDSDEGGSELDVLRLATAELEDATRGLSHLIRDWREEHRADRADLRARVDRIERHLDLPPR